MMSCQPFRSQRTGAPISSVLQGATNGMDEGLKFPASYFSDETDIYLTPSARSQFFLLLNPG
jgi:hypothetical protein